MRPSRWEIDNLNQDGNRHVICMQCALARTGLTLTDGDTLDLWTPYPEIDGVSTLLIRYLYHSAIDYEYELTPEKTNPYLLRPSKERALIEYIQCERWCDEGELIEGLQTYLAYFYNEEKLMAAARHFGVPWETVKYYLHEAETDGEV